MGRPTVWHRCDTLRCEGEFYARRWITDFKVEYLCKRCYNRKHIAEKRKTTICNKRGCAARTECKRFEYYHCRVHHNELFHEMDSPLYVSKEDCGCTGLGRLGCEVIDFS